ncbi:MAG: single-stranded-DNA-specific exonuclease RecJ [Candidatus Andersenbacteria bacterium]|nr:single-stranded-DNA-specific exonuclease RecJ [Candidatus Andersenbacteria bacterium]MBI3251073.1 single-stranded-DNA-specific exonuclease RecJ [Candidatus Andersenbacteria bacterium]
MKRTWKVTGDTTPIEELVALQLQLCRLRNIDEAGSDLFFAPNYDSIIHNPHELTDMSEAVERITSAVKKGEHILVWGDYDADGVSATAVLTEALIAVGAAVAPYLPHRTDEGYGLNLKTLKTLAGGFDLLITVDCGIGNLEEINWLKSQGKDVIVVDHHEIPKELPPARAILHPRHPAGNYPWPHLCGAGVAWKLSQALFRHEPLGPRSQDDEKWLLDLPLLGTLGDVMPLMGENRGIVRFGLEVLRRTRRPGLRALMEATRVERQTITARQVVFRLVPLINAAGRMDHPQAALDVLLAKTMEQGQLKAQILMQLNAQRRILTRKILKEAEEKVDPALPVVFAFDKRWAPGVVGIVAGQLAQKHGKPALVIGSNGREAVGSARTAAGIDIHAVLQQAAKHTIKLGGHKQAAGFSLAEGSIVDFRDAVTQILMQDFVAANDGTSLSADAIITPRLLQWDTHALLQRFEPFGEGNPAPKFVIRNVPVVRVRRVGKDQSHLKLTLKAENQDIEAIGFGLGENVAGLPKTVDVLGTLNINTFRGVGNLEVAMDDVAPAGSVTITE